MTRKLVVSNHGHNKVSNLLKHVQKETLQSDNKMKATKNKSQHRNTLKRE